MNDYILSNGTYRRVGGTEYLSPSAPVFQRSPEMSVYGVLATLGQTYLGNKVKVSAGKSGGRVQLKVSGLPVYNAGTDTISLNLPYGNIQFPEGGVRCKPFYNKDCFYTYQGRDFPHPHMFSGGVPCWDGKTLTSLGSLFENWMNTILWKNVTRDSMTYGHFVNNVTARDLGSDPIREAQKFRNSLKKYVDHWDVAPIDWYNAHYAPLLSFIIRGVN